SASISSNIPLSATIPSARNLSLPCSATALANAMADLLYRGYAAHRHHPAFTSTSITPTHYRHPGLEPGSSNQQHLGSHTTARQTSSLLPLREKVPRRGG